MSKTNWQAVDLDGDDDDKNIEVEIKTDGDEQVLVSDDDDSESDGEAKAKKPEAEDEKNETESEDDDEEKKPKKRRGGRAAQRIRALSDKLKQQENHWKTELEKVRNEVHATVNSQKNNETIASIDQQLALAKQNLVRAKENSDYTAEADALAEISQLALDRRVAQAQSKTAATDKKETPTKEQQQQQVQAAPEAYNDWAEENPWFEDPATPDERRLVRFLKKKAAELVNEDGYTVEDDDFYEELNTTAKEYVNQRKLSIDGFEVEQQEKKKQKTSPVGSGKDESIIRRTDGGVRISLTKADREMADRLGVDYKEYAKQKLKTSKQTKTGYSNIF